MSDLVPEHPWSRLFFLSSFEHERRRRGTLKERQTKSQRHVTEVVNLFKDTRLELPRKKRLRPQASETGIELICVNRRLKSVSNSPFVAQTWLDRYNAVWKEHPEWFHEVAHFDEEAVQFPDCFLRAIASTAIFVVGRDKMDDLKYSMVLLSVTGSPFLPWSEITLRSSFISDVAIALRKLDSDGGES